MSVTERQCVACGDEFLGTKRARYCGVKCRVRWHRDSKLLQSEKKEVETDQVEPKYTYLWADDNGMTKIGVTNNKGEARPKITARKRATNINNLKIYLTGDNTKRAEKFLLSIFGGSPYDDKIDGYTEFRFLTENQRNKAEKYLSLLGRRVNTDEEEERNLLRLENKKLREALDDVIDGNSWYDLVLMTGLSEERCRGIIKLTRKDI